VTRQRIAPTYNDQYLEIDRPQPLADRKIEQLQQDVLDGKLDKDISNTVYDNFKSEFNQYIAGSSLNNLKGLEKFLRVDVINGCTQFIDTIYMGGRPQTLSGDYRYHARLGNQWSYPKILKESVPLIIALPFPSIGDIHEEMEEILDEAFEKNISVHIDGAWVTCSRDIDFDFSHPAIKSVGISLSKGLGLGWNRVGLRWTRETNVDAVTIQNDFNMNLRAPVMIGLHFIRNLPIDYLWHTHGERYYKVCKDFNLTPTRSIYLALKDGHPVGVSPLIRYLEENESI
jgi:hypothetical protein